MNLFMKVRLLVLSILLWMMTCVSVEAKDITVAWDKGTNWTDQTQVVLVVEKPTGEKFRLPSVPALDLKQVIDGGYFEFGKEYKMYAVAFNAKSESGPSNTVTYLHPQGPDVLEYPLLVPIDKPDTVIIQLNFNTGG